MESVHTISLRRICAALVSAIAMVVIIGWFTHNEQLVQLRPNYTPMKFNSAVCFILCSIALFSLDTKFRNIGVICSGFAVILAGLTLLEYLLGVDFSIDTMFNDPFTNSNTPLPGRMSPNAAIAFILIGTALFITTASKKFGNKKSLLIALLACISAGLGFAPLIGYLSGVDEVLTWGHYVRMAAHTASCFVLLSVCVVLYTWKQSADNAMWLPIPVFIGFISVSIALSQAVSTQEDSKFEKSVQVEADHIAEQAESKMSDLYKALDRVALRWNAAKGTPKNLWLEDTRQYLNAYPYLAGMSKTDAETHIEWITGRTGDTRALGFKLNSEPTRAKAINKAIETKKPQVTEVLQLLNNGGAGFLYVNPLYSDEHLDGMQVSVFKINDLFAAVLKDWDNNTFYITAKENNKILFSNVPKDYVVNYSWQKFSYLKNVNSTWQVIITPNAQAIASKNSALSALVLMVGIFTSILLALCTYLTLKWQYNSHSLKKTAEILDQSDRFNKAILSSAAYMVIATDINGRVLLFNHAAEISLKYKSSQVENLATPALWHDKEEVAARARQLSIELGREIKPGFDVFITKPLLDGSEKREWTFIDRDGTRFPVELMVTPLRDAEQNVVGFMGIIQDITVRKKQEQDLKASEERFRTSMENAPIGKALVSPDSKWLMVNKALCEIVGYTPEELLKIDFQTITHPEDLENDLGLLMQVIEKKIPSYQMEKRYFHKDGHTIWIQLSVSPAWNSDGTLRYFISQIQDITDRKIADEERSKLIAIIEESADYIGMADLNGNLQYHNRSALRLIGLPDDYDLSKLKITDMHPQWAIKLITEEAIPATYATGTWQGETALLHRSDGHEIPVLQNLALHRNSKGEPVCFTTIIRDISVRKEAELEREKLITKLAESNTELERFAYVASHDMQEPIRMIANFSHIIADEYASKLDDEGKEYLNHMTDGALRMQAMIADLLEYARVGNEVTRFVEVNMQNELKHVIENLAVTIDETKAKITYDRLPNVTGNPVQLMRLMQNLIGNGLKYQEAGITPKVHVGVEDHKEFWEFYVKDNGIGMKEEHVSQIFEPFKRLHTWQEYKGTGIGLAVCKKIVETHGGKIWATSSPNKGSTFHFTISKHQEE